MPHYIDLSHPISDGMPVYPGDLPVSLKQHASLQADGHTNFSLSTGMHAGTHLDGPMHLTSSLTRMAQLPIDQFAGNGFLVNATGLKNIDLPESAFDQVKPGSIVLFYTGFDRYFGEEKYYLDYPPISEKTARLLAKKQVKMVGMDTPSPDFHPYRIHQIWLTNGILVLENLTNLSALLPYREFELLAFPLKIEADSSPVRVVARIPD